MREELAAYSHNAWAGWMNYQRTKGSYNPDGSFTINKESMIRWDRQSKTDFYDLPDTEKKSDFSEADKILAITKRAASP